jgi:ribosomal protein S18 acetylase RimI-like enzyme
VAAWASVLMHKLIDHLRERGTQRLVATVLAENTRMLELAAGLGFERVPLRAGRRHGVASAVAGLTQLMAVSRKRRRLEGLALLGASGGQPPQWVLP